MRPLKLFAVFVFTSFQCMPCLASPSLLATDMLEPGEVILATEFEYGVRRWTSAYVERANAYASNSTNDRYSARSDLMVGVGITPDVRLSVHLPYLLDETQTTKSIATDGEKDVLWSFRGAQDIKFVSTFLLVDSGYRFAIRGTLSLPSGDDTPSHAQIIDSNGNQVSALKLGGAGMGRTDVRASIHWSLANHSWTPYATVGYLVRGDKTEHGTHYDYANTIDYALGGLFGGQKSWNLKVNINGKRNTASQIGSTTHAADWSVAIATEIIKKLTPNTYVVIGTRWGRTYDSASTTTLTNGTGERTYSSQFSRSTHLSIATTF